MPALFKVSYLSGIGMDRWTYPGKAGWRYEEHHAGGHEGGAHEAWSEHDGNTLSHWSNNTGELHGPYPLNNDSYGSQLPEPDPHGPVQLTLTGHDDSHRTAEQTHGKTSPEKSNADHPAAGSGHGQSNAANEADLQDDAGGSGGQQEKSGRHRRQIEYNGLSFAVPRRHFFSSTTSTTTLEPTTVNVTEASVYSSETGTVEHAEGSEEHGGGHHTVTEAGIRLRFYEINEFFHWSH